MYPLLIFLIVHHHHSITDTVVSHRGPRIGDYNPGTHISFARSVGPQITGTSEDQSSGGVIGSPSADIEYTQKPFLSEYSHAETEK